MGLFLIVAVTIFILYIISYYMNVRKYPKGPFPLPLIGNLYHMPVTNQHKYFDELSKTYGHCYTLFLPKPTVFLTNYKFIKEALVTQGDLFIGRSHLPPENLLQRENNTGILISDGVVWREQRRLSLKILRDFGLGKNLMEQQITRSIGEMMKQLESYENKDEVDMFLPIQLCIGNVINEILFGFIYSYKDCKTFEHFVSVITKHLTLIRQTLCVFLIQAFPWMKNLPIIGYEGYYKMKENISLYHNFIENEVDKQIATFDENSPAENFVHAYMIEMRKEGNNNMSLNKENLCASVIDFWLAGMETTSTSLRWHILYMMAHPYIQARVREEIDTVIGGREATMADRAKMPYIQAVSHEIQRISNMVPFLGFHRCTEDTTLFGHPIPQDTLVMAQIYSVLANDEMFENPEQFCPERFLLEDEKTINKPMVDRLIAFGMGKRQCVGEGLARMELFLIFVALLQKYEFHAVRPIDLEPVFSTVLFPKTQMAKLVKRH